jgi:hypothetical protein
LFTASQNVVQVSLDGGNTWANAPNSPVSGDSTSFVYNVDPNMECGTQMAFQVYAIEGNVSTPVSNAISAFVYRTSNVPTQVAVSNAVLLDSGYVTFTAAFSNPNDIGCGTPSAFGWSVTDSSGNTVQSQGTNYITYAAGANPYSVNSTFQFAPTSTGFTYAFNVNLYTTDPNSTHSFVGSTASTNINVSTAPPQISNLAFGGNSIHFNVLTPSTDLLNYRATIGWTDATNHTMRYIPVLDITSFNVPPYTPLIVNNIDNVNTDAYYTIAIDLTNNPSGILNASQIMVSVSNGYGVGSDVSSTP